MTKAVKILSISIYAIAISVVSAIYAEESNVIKLSPPQFDRGKLLMQALKDRKSTRSFSAKELPLDVLSNLLWAAFGVNRPDISKRTAPSAMNRQEIDIYVAMEKGVHKYDASQHVLEPVMAKDIREFAGTQEFMRVSPVNLIYVADFSKMSGNEENKILFSAADTGFIRLRAYTPCVNPGINACR
ncbi:MAG: hypothetical protein A2Z72_04790 [Omnitrophica bacterium RBG_13_46_9]|nr:MAG: hypothetical protein A2Z72_04790 [Omnitrophica bacterium RBG_13_46_9]